VAQCRRHTWRNPPKPPTDPVPDPEKIIREGKALQKGASSSESSQSETECHLAYIHTNLPVVQLAIQELSSKGEESLAKLLSGFYRDSYSLDSSFIVSPKKSSPHIHHTRLVISAPPQPSVIQASSTFISTIAMAAPQAPTKIERIIDARYGPLVLPTPLSSMPTGEYQNYMPKFTGIEGIIAEEHLELFYIYANNSDISEVDVSVRVFVQSLDGEARKWFRELTPRSIVDVEALDDDFLKHWGDKKYLLYYHIEFVNLKRENVESLSDFNKRFNRMYNKILAKVKPTTTFGKLNYANSFDADFFLLLIEGRCATLANMHDPTLEVDQILWLQKNLREKLIRENRRMNPHLLQILRLIK